MKKTVYRIFILCLSFFVLFSENLYAYAENDNVEINAPSAILMEAGTGTVIYEKNPDEIRRVPWLFDPITKKRTVEVNAYIKGMDVVLVDDEGTYITTMKDGANNRRIKGGGR